MGRASFILLMALATLAGTVGCSLCRHGQRGGAGCDAEPVEPALPAVERSPLEPNLLALAAGVRPSGPPTDSSSPTTYRAFSPAQSQCLAAKHAPLADSLDQQRQRLLEQGASKRRLCDHKSDKQRAFQESMLLYSALELRDQAAGTALQWYYELAGGEAKTDLLDAGLARGRDTLQRVQRLKQQGIRLPAPIEEYQRQIVGLQLQQAQNQLTITQLNSKLRLATGFDSAGAWRFWPDAGAPLGAESVPDVEAAVRVGLAERPQLRMLQAMIQHLDRDTLGAARTLLQSLSPLLGLSSPPTHCKPLILLGKVIHVQPGQDDEVERARAQLSDYLRARERTVSAEIREAAYEVEARKESILLAREASDRWEERIKDLEKQQVQGMPVFAELTSAHMDWYKARGEVIKEYLGWKIAIVKLKQAQGILPAECGYGDCKESSCHQR
jgi:hypothetical protein